MKVFLIAMALIIGAGTVYSIGHEKKERVKMKDKILVVLADGFEEIEFTAPVDIWRRIQLNVVTAGLNSKKVTGSHGITIETDTTLKEVDLSQVKLVFLPGGMPGSKNLRESEFLMTVLNKIYNDGGIVSAICAAPIALGKAGLLKDKKATCYPGFEEMLGGASYTANRIEIDGRVITGKGPGVSFEFAAAVAGALGKKDAIEKTFEGMFVR